MIEKWAFWKKSVPPVTTSTKISESELRTKWIEKFFRRSEHSWISNDHRLNRAFRWMWEVIPFSAIEYLSSSTPTLFVFSSGRLSGTYHQAEGQHIILIFPDLLKLLRAADPAWGVATLVHEVGHVLENHSGKNHDPIQAQIEADAWVVRSGLDKELESILLTLPESVEKRIRLSALTTRVLSASPSSSQ